MKALTKIQITDDNGIKFFGEGPCRLLRYVEKTGSLRAAALEMEMAYSKASRLLKQAEANLGFPWKSAISLFPPNRFPIPEAMMTQPVFGKNCR